MSKVGRYYYVITGVSDDPDNGTTVFGPSLFSSLEKARHEIENILQEIHQESVEQNYAYTHRWYEPKLELEVTFDTGTVETYTIRKVKLN